MDKAVVGACYTSCEPGKAGTCGPDACDQLDRSGDVGFCRVSLGSDTNGAACQRADVGSSCAADLLCLNEGTADAPKRVCRQSCDGYAAEPGCPASTICLPFDGVCSDIAVATATRSKAALDKPCTDKPGGTLCGGTDGKGFRGICVDTSAKGEPACFQLVSSGGTCPAGTAILKLSEVFQGFDGEAVGICNGI